MIHDISYINISMIFICAKPYPNILKPKSVLNFYVLYDMYIKYYK